MATRNLGFERARNLEESVDDRQILNNLGGGNIQLDIALFRNNLRNVSELIWEYDTDGSIIANNKFLFPRTVLFVYTNEDEVKVQGTSLGNLSENETYYVVDLELNTGTQKNQQAFGLATTLGGTRVTVGQVDSDITFIRTDIVTKKNLLRLATPAIQDTNIGLEGDSFSYDIGPTFTDAFDTIDERVGLFNFLRREKYVSNDSVSSSRRIVIEGSVINEDPAEFNSTQTNLDEDNSPGVYITNPFSNVLEIEKTRAYSTSSQPWAEGTNDLITRSTQVNIGDLLFSNGIKFNSIDDVNEESGQASNFDHKIPIIVDGVEYFVLLNSE